MLLGWSLNRFAFFTTLFIIHVGEIHQPQVQVEKEWKAHWSRRLTMIQGKPRGRPSTWQPTFRQAQPARSEFCVPGRGNGYALAVLFEIGEEGLQKREC